MNDSPVLVELTHDAIDVARILSHVQSSAAGAVVLFLGTTRDQTEGRATESLDYEAFDEMAVKLMRELADNAVEKWDLCRAALVHRVGHLVPPEASVAIAVSAPHRPAAFEAGRWLIDSLKELIPIWKRENWADGTSDWVMPGITRDTVPEQEEAP